MQPVGEACRQLEARLRAASASNASQHRLRAIVRREEAQRLSPSGPWDVLVRQDGCVCTSALGAGGRDELQMSSATAAFARKLQIPAGESPFSTTVDPGSGRHQFPQSATLCPYQSRHWQLLEVHQPGQILVRVLETVPGRDHAPPSPEVTSSPTPA